VKHDPIPRYGPRAETHDITPDRLAVDHAASLSACVTSVDVILIATHAPETLSLASWMRACGLNVMSGPDCGGIEAPVIVVLARDLRDVAARVAAAREVFPDAPLCAVMGIQNAVRADVVLHFDDARSILLAAGVRFLTLDAL
jgi:hypothetical protein